MAPFQAFVQGDKLSREIIANFVNIVAVLLDERGRILDVAGSMPDSPSNNCIQYLVSLLKGVPDINVVFEPKPTPSFTSKQEEPADQGFHACRKGAINFLNEPEEFHSIVPLAFLKRFPVDDGRVVGIIKLAAFYSALLSEARQYPLFCLDGKGRIIGYNRRFQDIVHIRGKRPGYLLERGIKECLSNTPHEIQTEIIDNTKIPGPDLFTPVLLKEAEWGPGGLKWRAADDPSYLPLLNGMEWPKSDFRLEISTGFGTTGLPCLIIGDDLESSPVQYPDQDGYLFGPGPFNDSLALKKSGRSLYYQWTEPERLKGGDYVYYKIGNVFLLEKDGKTIFAYADLDLLRRERPVSLLLYLRSNNGCGLKRLCLGTRPSVPFPAGFNVFTTPAGNPGAFFLVSCMDSRAGPSRERSRHLYRLQDMTDIRMRMDALQKSFEDALKKERAASLELSQYRDGESAFIASGKTMSLLREKAERLAATSSSILIYGETGTGKEVLARFVHNNSPFAQGPFVKVDCSTLPSTLMESLLFGHEKGAFTGADTAKKGLFEMAQDGTLFLDEISNMGLDIQAKLLQFLQDHSIVRVGGHGPLKLNLRVIVASNAPLEERVSQGSFRQDLYYRIAVAIILLPPLRDRREDIPLLVKYFLDSLNLKYHKNVKGFAPAAFKAMDRYGWPGNIRELRNVIERAFLYCDKETVSEELLSLPGPAPIPDQPRKQKAHQALNVDKQEMTALFNRHHGMVGRVAGELGVTRQAVYGFFRKHGMAPNALRKNPRKQ